MPDNLIGFIDYTAQKRLNVPLFQTAGSKWLRKMGKT